MRAIQLLQAQLQGINMLFHAVLDDLTDEEWTMRVLPETNLIAFDLWHVARTQDATVQTALRGVPEIISQARWASCGALATPGFGLQLSRAQADALARGITRTDVGVYADAVLAEILAWLETIADDELDAVPDIAARLSTVKGYEDPDVQKEVLEGQGSPAWGYLSGPCIGHCRLHLGQLILLKEQLRLRAAPPSAAPSPPMAVPASDSPASAETMLSVKRGRWPWRRK
jgi:hypothetical protein